MKKTLRTLCALGLIFSVSSLCAELHKPRRYVELGVDAKVGISNNYFAPADILTETIELDLTKLANDMPDEGFTLDMLADAGLFINLNFSPKFRLGFFANVETSAYTNMPKDIFDMLGKGYSVGETLDFDVSGYADIFLDAGFSFHTTLFGIYGITLSPAYYVPVLYIDNAKASVYFTTTKEGEILANINAPVDVYSAIDLQPYVDDKKFSAGGLTEKLSESLKEGGFDLTFAVERPILKTLEAGVYGRIPLVPATLKYSMHANAYAHFYQDNLLGWLLDDDDDTEKDSGMDDIVYRSDGSKHVWRPFRLGLEAAWRPFGDWFAIRPKVGVVARNPYDSHTRIIFPEYALDVEAVLFKVLGFSAGTAFENRVFIQRLGLMINARLLEIDIQAMLRGSSFVNSFTMTGAGAYIGVRVGF